MKYLNYLGLIVFIYILSTLNINVFIDSITTINYIYLVLAFLLNFPMIYCKSLRWQQILIKQNILLTSKKTFEYYMSSLFLGFITPGRIGEFSRALYIKKNYIDKGYGAVFSSVIIDRLFDLYLLVTLSIIGFVNLSLEIDIFYSISFISIFFIIPFIVIKTSILLNILNILANKFSESFKEKSKIFIDDFISSFKSVLSYKNLILFSIITILSYIIFFIQVYLISRSLDMNINFVTLTLIMAISNTISLLPISVSGIGTRDIVLIYFLVPLGFSTEVTVMYSTLVLAVFFVGCSVIGLIYFIKNPINIKLIRREYVRKNFK